MQQSQRNVSPLEGLAAIAIVFWLFFMGGLSYLRSPKTADVMKTGVQRIIATAAPIATAAAISAESAASRATKPAAATPGRIVLPVPATAGAPVVAAPTARPTTVPAPIVVPATAGGAAPAPAEAPAAAVALSVPEGQHTDIHPDGSFTIDGGNTRYYPDTNGAIVDVRLKGSEDYLKNLPTEAPAPTVASYVAPTPDFVPCAARHGCPARKP